MKKLYFSGNPGDLMSDLIPSTAGNDYEIASNGGIVPTDVWVESTIRFTEGYDQNSYSEATFMRGALGGGGYFGVSIRATASGTSGYAATINNLTAATSITVVKSGSWFAVVSLTNTYSITERAITLRLTHNPDNSLTVDITDGKNTEQHTTASDSTPLTGGHPGVVQYRGGAVGIPVLSWQGADPSSSASQDIILPNKFLKAPELFLPMRKPIGAVEVDLIKPFTEDMVGYFLCDRVPYGLGMRNLVKGFPSLASVFDDGAAVNYLPAPEVDNVWGRVLELDGQSYGSNKSPSDEDVFTDGEGGFSTLVVYKLHSYYSSAGAPVAIGDTSASATTAWAIKDYPGGTQCFSNHDTTGTSIVGSSSNGIQPPLNTWVRRLMTWKRGDAMRLYESYDGLEVTYQGQGEVTTGNLNAGSKASSGASAFRFGLGDADGSTSGARGFKGQIALGIVWKTGFTDGDPAIEHVLKNPYWCLKAGGLV